MLPITEFKEFHPDPNINFQLNRLLIPGLEQQFAEIGAKIKDFDDWKSQFRGAAPAHEERGDLSQAARLYRAAEFFMSSGDPDRERAADRFIELFYRVHDNQNLQRIEIPYGTGHLYGLRLHSAAQSRGTIVIHAGFDAYVEEFYALAEAIALCGYAVVTFDGHGQGSTLLREKMPMTHEWEKPVGAVLDHLGLADVTLIGISLGGYLAIRAAAFEPRIRRVVACDVMLDFFQCVASRRGKLVEVALNVFVRLGLSTPLDMMARSLMKRDLYSKWGIQQGMHVTGSASPSEYFFKLKAYFVPKKLPKSVYRTGVALSSFRACCASMPSGYIACHPAHVNADGLPTSRPMAEQQLCGAVTNTRVKFKLKFDKHLIFAKWGEFGYAHQNQAAKQRVAYPSGDQRRLVEHPVCAV